MSEVQKEEGEEKVEELSPHVGLREMCRILDRSNVWIRRMVKDGRFKSAVKVDGRWRIDREEVLVHLDVLKEKEERYEKKKRGEFKYPYSRPSQTSIRMIRSKVSSDDVLDDSTKEAFLEALVRYEVEYEEAYLEKKSK